MEKLNYFIDALLFVPFILLLSSSYLDYRETGKWKDTEHVIMMLALLFMIVPDDFTDNDNITVPLGLFGVLLVLASVYVGKQKNKKE